MMTRRSDGAKRRGELPFQHHSCRLHPCTRRIQCCLGRCRRCYRIPPVENDGIPDLERQDRLDIVTVVHPLEPRFLGGLSLDERDRIHDGAGFDSIVDRLQPFGTFDVAVPLEVSEKEIVMNDADHYFSF